MTHLIEDFQISNAWKLECRQSSPCQVRLATHAFLQALSTVMAPVFEVTMALCQRQIRPGLLHAIFIPECQCVSYLSNEADTSNASTPVAMAVKVSAQDISKLAQGMVDVSLSH